MCPTEILSFNDALPAFKALNTAVLGISTDSEYTHLAWAGTPRARGGLGPDLQLPLVSDRSHAVARAYGVLLEDAGVALRGLFLVDPQGVLRQATVNDLPIGRSVDETLRLVQAFQFADEFGEVCPAGWHQGDKGMKADPKGSLEWFADQAAADGKNGKNGTNDTNKRARVQEQDVSMA